MIHETVICTVRSLRLSEDVSITAGDTFSIDSLSGDGCWHLRTLGCVGGETEGWRWDSEVENSSLE